MVFNVSLFFYLEDNIKTHIWKYGDIGTLSGQVLTILVCYQYKKELISSSKMS